MSEAPESGIVDDEITLRPYLDALWRYRRIIQMSMLAAALLFLVAALGLFLILPAERVGVLQFRLLFSGADGGTYPNGTVFNATEIAATPVLTEVFASNALERYTNFAELQQSLFVLQSNPAMQRLDNDYQAKLSSTTLGTVDRARLEDEYLRKRDTLRDPIFDLTLRRAGGLVDMPDELMATVLADVLETWARQADTQKGAARPDVDVVSREVFARAAVETESYLVRIDVLRTGAQRIIKTLTALQQVPGARAVRTEANRNLADELATVEDIVKFDIEPLMGLARVAGSSGREQVVLRAYLSNQLVTYRLDLRAASTRAQNLQISLREYMAQRGGRIDTPPTAGTSAPAQGTNVPLVPQVSDSFIDRLMEMSAATQASESEYRRNLTNRFIEASEQAAVAEREIGYYDDLLKQLATGPSPSGTIGMEVLTARFTNVFEMLNETVDRVQKLYNAISVQTLNPSRRLYSVTRPFRLQTFSSVSPRTVFLAFLLTMLGTFLITVAGCLFHNFRAAAPTSTRESSFKLGV
jgi:hypothetical protein